MPYFNQQQPKGRVTFDGLEGLMDSGPPDWRVSDIQNTIGRQYELMYREIMKKHSDALKLRLGDFGISFETDWEWEEFAKERLTTITHADRPTFRELYLDYETEDRKLVATWYHEIHLDLNESKDGKFSTTFTATYGR